MADKESCAKRLTAALSMRKMSQAELCRITGIPKSAMSQYCNGGLVPRQNRTFLMASALNVSEAWLMGFPVPMERNIEDRLPSSLEGIDFALSGEIHELTEGEKLDLLAYIRFKKAQKEGKEQ